MLTTGCSAKSADTNETSSEIATETEISSEETEIETETEIDGETEEEAETETETEEVSEEETVNSEEESGEETSAEETEDVAEESSEEEVEDNAEENSAEETEDTVEKTTEESTEVTTEATTEATTEETTAATVQSVSASVNGTHYIGESLTVRDFTVTVNLSDGSTLTNPEGWAAAPLELTASSNVITVYYESVSTTIEVSAETAPETTTAAPTTAAPTTAATTTSSTSYLQVVDTSTAMYTYDSMVEDLNQLAAAYPDIIDLESAGTTADGRTIYVVYFGNRNASQQIFICAATHAREYMTAQLVMKQLEFYSGNYDTGTYNGRSFRDIFTETCFVVVPMVNPDGVSISQLGEAGIRDESLRANLRAIYESDVAHGYTTYDYAYYLVRWKANARGVDINRNFSPGWESVTDRSAPSSTFYKGTEPGSEAETQALMNLVNSMSNPLMVISYHSYGDLVYWQYGQSEPLWSANQSLAQAISNLTGHYLAGYSNEAGFSNWCVRVKGIRSVTVETGTVACPLPIEQFSKLWGQHQYTWTMLAGL